MAESTLSIAFSDMVRHVSRFLGWTRQPEYATGTITVVAGVVTLAGGTWPSWAAAGTIQIGSSFYTVASRDSNSQITLDNTGVAAAALTTYTLFNLSEDEAIDMHDITKSCQRSFYTPEGGYRWTFMDPLARLATQAPYSTGTIAVASGVVTLTSGTFPSWAALGDLRVNGVSYKVSTRDGNTQVTLVDTGVTVSSGTSYQLVEQWYDLPDDFGGLHPGGIAERPNQSNFRYPLQRVAEEAIRTHSARYITADKPTAFAIRPKAIPADGSEGQRWEIGFDCPTDAAYSYEYRYTVNPEAMTSADPYPWGGMAHAETFIALALAAADRIINDRVGEAAAYAKERLMASIQSDQVQMVPDRLGQGVRNSQRTDRSPLPPLRTMVEFTSSFTV